MSTAETTRRYTPDDLLKMQDGERYELVDGDLMERNVSGLSSLVARKISGRVGEFTDQSGLGYTFGQDCSYQCYPFDPGKVRRPDGSFIRADRVSLEELESGYVSVAPDLAIEVVSPNDLAYELKAKVEEYLSAGAKLVWVIDPQSRTLTVHRPDGTDSRLHEGDELTGEAVLPGFKCSVRELFPERKPAAAT
ncbi:MAG: Uma2 family endonuclease [Planctomycetota bacterium]|nr:Uma2 family endonuclease [Planctomycetaceae bacterium]MDQ3331538.1 Uma2 family endonuclease [Planctomycetota bacterium]